MLLLCCEKDYCRFEAFESLVIEKQAVAILDNNESVSKSADEAWALIYALFPVNECRKQTRKVLAAAFPKTFACCLKQSFFHQV